MLNISNICSLLNKVLRIIKISANKEIILTKATFMSQSKIMANKKTKGQEKRVYFDN